MKKNIIIVSVFVAMILFVASCKKDDGIITNPEPVEQELITRVTVTITGTGGFDRSFSYSIENGFGGTTPGSINIDTIKLDTNKQYSVAVEVWNDKASPAENVTDEVNSENTEHLFLWEAAPSTGAGGISFANGNTDDNGNPFNQNGTVTTGSMGNGQLTVTLKHQPTNKAANTASAAGGETDAEAIFPVSLR